MPTRTRAGRSQAAKQTRILSGMSMVSSANAFWCSLSSEYISNADLYHVLRALTYFEDAEKDPVYPRGLTPARWERIKKFFLAEAPKVLLGE
jgi:hypothetical protein